MRIIDFCQMTKKKIKPNQLIKKYIHLGLGKRVLFLDDFLFDWQMLKIRELFNVVVIRSYPRRRVKENKQKNIIILKMYTPWANLTAQTKKSKNSRFG